MPIEQAPTAPSIHEALVSAMEQHPAEPIPAQETPPADPQIQAEAKDEAPAQETDAQKAERLRDEKGQFVKGKAPEKKSETQAAPAVQAAKPKTPRPSSWKKELESHWDTLPPEVQQYVGQREKEYQTGVSTYKTEADRAREVMGVISQFQPHLERHGVPVQKWLTDLGTAHHTLALGTPQDKVQQVARIIQGYGVDAQALYQMLSGQQPTYQQQPAQAPAAPQTPRITPQDIDKVVEEKLIRKEAEAAFKSFTEAKNERGEAKYPYHEELQGSMAGLLQAGLAPDYASAYEAALALPSHANIREALAKQQAEQKAAETAAAAPAKASPARARSQAVSVKSSTPSSTGAPEGSKGLRSTLLDAFDRVESGRV